MKKLLLTLILLGGVLLQGINYADYGAGPMLDLGPYYITALVNMLGPAESVTAVTTKGFENRTYGPVVADEYKDKYQPFGKYPVNVTTHLTGIIKFKCGAVITVITSFDCYNHGHSPIEIYGTEGSMQVPDPNIFGGKIRVFKKHQLGFFCNFLRFCGNRDDPL